MTAPAGERGAATAEMVMMLPLLVIVTMALAWLISLGSAQARVVDAAREAARAVARGEDPGVATARAAGVGPAGTSVRIEVLGTVVRATASVMLRPPFAQFHLLDVAAHADATAVLEPCGAAC